MITDMQNRFHDTACAGPALISRSARLLNFLPVSLLVAALFFFSAGKACAAPLYAERTDRASIEDMAGILSDEEERDLLSLAEQISLDNNMDIRVVTTDDTGGKSTRSFSDDYFESLTGTYEGACYLIDMDNREFYLTTEGRMIWYINDDRRDAILDHAYGYASSGDFDEVFRSMLSDTQRFLNQGVEHGTVQYDEDTGTYTYYSEPKGVTCGEGLLAGLIGLLTAAGSFFGIRAKYQLKFPEKENYSFHDNVHLNLNMKQDSFVRRFVTHRHIPRNTGGGGGGHSHTSTTHHTSSGHSAGGGGRKF